MQKVRGETVLVYGSGWLGGKIQGIGKPSQTRTGYADISDAREVAAEIRRLRPGVVINAAGRSGLSSVDWCETHPVETHLSNVAGPLVLAAECADRGIPLIHIGSGCIYDGTPVRGDWTEEDPPNFDKSLYSRSKILAERALADFPDVMQLRIRMPFDGVPHPRNLITKLIRYRRVIDVPNSLTGVGDLLRVIATVVPAPLRGIWNVVNKGAITNVEILELYRQVVDANFTFERMDYSELASKVVAPRSNCVLSSEKIGAVYRMPEVREALRKTLAVYGGGRDEAEGRRSGRRIGHAPVATHGGDEQAFAPRLR